MAEAGTHGANDSNELPNMNAHKPKRPLELLRVGVVALLPEKTEQRQDLCAN